MSFLLTSEPHKWSTNQHQKYKTVLWVSFSGHNTSEIHTETLTLYLSACAPWFIRIATSTPTLTPLLRDHIHSNTEHVIRGWLLPGSCPCAEDCWEGTKKSTEEQAAGLTWNPAALQNKPARSPMVGKQPNRSLSEPHRGSWVKPLLPACGGSNETHHCTVIKQKMHRRYAQNWVRKASIIYLPGPSRKLGSS